ncbi:hypothetical protein B6V75_10100 [Thioclava sp. F1Mire-8]|nr:hypothetical protein B6V75_10100 [Thioclava sp. F1Mire-8]
MTKRVAIYARYSSGLQKQTSIDDQVAMAERFAAERGWVVTHRFTDYEKSGRNTRREGLQALCAAVNARRVDAIVIEAVDRLTRKIADALNHYELFQFQQAELYSVAEGQQDFFKVLINALGAQLYAQMIGEHTRRGMVQGLTRKRLHTSAYGYRKRDGDEGLNREINPEEADIVRRIFREFADGHSTQAIVKRLNGDGIPAPRGGTWDISTIRGNPARFEGMLRNRLYIGVASVAKTSRRYHPETGSKEVYETPSAAAEIEIPALRIVDQDLWDRVETQLATQAAKTKSKGNPVGARRSKHLLSGLLVCGCCGATYVKVGRTHFGCREARKGACSNKTTIHRDRIEARVFAKLRGTFLTPELAASFDAALKAEYTALANDQGVDTVTRLERRLKKARTSRQRIFDAIEQGAPYSAYKARAEDLEREIADLEAELAQHQETRAVLPQLPSDSAALFARAVQELETLLADPELVHQANEHLRELIRRVELRPDPDAPDALAAEILTDLGALLSAGGATPSIGNIFSSTRQLSIRQGALPPPPPESPRIFGPRRSAAAPLMSENLENRFRRAADAGRSLGQHQGALDQLRVGGERREDFVFAGLLGEVGILPADQGGGGLAELHQRVLQFDHGRRLFLVVAHRRRDPARFEKFQRLARFRAARIVPDRYSHLSLPVPIASETLAKPSRSRRASRPRAISAASERPENTIAV